MKYLSTIIIILALIGTALLLQKLSLQQEAVETTMHITSSAFEDGALIPKLYTCDGDRTLSPALSFKDVPEDAVSLVLIMDDPDVPKALRPDGVFDHWVLFNISPETREIPEGGTMGIAGVNSRGESEYAGPCPPPEYEPSEHRYFFKLYALDAMLPLSLGATRGEVEQAMQEHILEEAQLMGRYQRTQ